MSYSVVETFEDGEIFCQVVPDSWVKDGVLSWPPDDLIRKKAIEKKTVPDKSWRRINCTTLKTNIGKFIWFRFEHHIDVHLNDLFIIVIGNVFWNIFTLFINKKIK